MIILHHYSNQTNLSLQGVSHMLNDDSAISQIMNLFQIDIFHLNNHLPQVVHFMTSIISLVFTSYVLVVLAYSATTSPVWTENPLIKAGYNTLFTTTTSSGPSKKYNINYGNAFSNSITPYLAYGIQKYRGTDFFIVQSFKLNLVSSDSMKFMVEMTIYGTTNPTLMALSYIAIDPTFPYYFNAFTEIPLNYASTLSNFSTASTSLVYHYEVVDYTNVQNVNSASFGPVRTHKTFSSPFTQYKIGLFLTGIDFAANSNEPIEFQISCQVIDSSRYSMNATLGYSIKVYTLQFSQVFMDSSQFTAGSSENLYYQERVVADSTQSNFFKYDSTLANNYMMGLKSFSTIKGGCSLEYQWDNSVIGTDHGALIQASVAYSSGACGLKSTVSTVIFMMTLSCPPSYVFKSATNLCQSCDPFTYLNATDNTCYPCLNTACYTCDSNNSNICLSCTNNFQLANQTCVCDTNSSEYLNVDGQCYSCSSQQSNCLTCGYQGNTSLAYVSSSFLCLSCNESNGYFLDPFDKCIPCSLSQCATCASYSMCSICNTGYELTISGTCSTCPIIGCTTCVNTTTCLTCSTGYEKINGLCYTCSVSCTCGGYTLPRYANGDCSTVCGDGIVIFPYEECDDGNANGGDGCSGACKVEANSACAGQPSVCYFTAALSAVLLSSQVSATQCNVVTFNFALSPNLGLLSNKNIVWTNALASQNASVLPKALSYSYSNGVISETFEFNSNLQNLNLVFKVNPTHLLSSIYLLNTPQNYLSFPVLPSNNLPAIYQQDTNCKTIQKVKLFTQVQIYMSYVGLFLSVISSKIIGLQMFGVLQLSYFSISNYDYVPLVLIGFMQRKQVNGFNVESSSANDNIPSRVSSNGYASSDFLNNFNIMFAFVAAIAIVGLIMYLVTYLINGQSLVEEDDNRIQNNLSIEVAITERVLEPQQESRSVYWHKVSKYILKEVLLTFILFNLFNISYSTGIQIKYIDEVAPFSSICLLFSLSLVLVILIAQIATNKVQFGEYMDKFKRERAESKYMIATIVYRFALGFLLAFINEWVASGVVLVALSAAFLAYVCFYDPFTDRFQNLRSKAVHSVHVLILFVNFYYRAEANSNPTEASQLSVPAYLQIVAVALTVFGSTALLAYEAYVKLRNYFSSERQSVEIPAGSQAKINSIAKVSRQ